MRMREAERKVISVDDKVLEFVKREGEVFIMKRLLQGQEDNESGSVMVVSRGKDVCSIVSRDEGFEWAVNRDTFLRLVTHKAIYDELVKTLFHFRLVEVKGNKDGMTEIEVERQHEDFDLPYLTIKVAYVGSLCQTQSQTKNGGWAMLMYKAKLLTSDFYFKLAEPADESIVAQESGGDINTTNNRMEMKAIISAVKHADKGILVICTDSMYCIDIFSRSLTLKNICEYKNDDLIKEYVDTISTKPELDVQFEWVKGHGGNAYIDKADNMALIACKKTYSQTSQNDKEGCNLPIGAKQENVNYNIAPRPIYIAYVGGFSNKEYYSTMIARPRAMRRYPSGWIFYSIYREDFFHRRTERRQSYRVDGMDAFFNVLQKVGQGADIVFRSDSARAVQLITQSRCEDGLTQEQMNFKRFAINGNIRYRAEYADPSKDLYMFQAIQMSNGDV